jgi:serine phosphatase RsbU (regulator of sigma subunit)
MLPPLTFGTDRFVIAAGVLPPHDVGGDAFDYGIDDSDARFALFDAMGHDLPAGLLSTVAMATYRNCRRRGLDLLATAHAIDQAVESGFGGQMFVTGVLCQLDLATGGLRYIVAGHPRPLVLRGGRIVKTLEGHPGVPFGVARGPRMFAEETLEPGDQIVLYTDGVVEARAANGEFFGVERLVDFIATASSVGAPPPETVRLLLHSILDYHDGELDDDATAMLVEWRGDGSERMTPT